MTGYLSLDWPTLGVSLFNTILLTWLGLTVLLNAERRTWGIWLAGGGLLMGGAFFVSHTAILGQGLSHASRGMDFWWHLGWGPVILSPFAWYLVVLWYAGFWDDREAPLRRRQRPWFLVTGLLALGLVGALLFANPLPSYRQAAQLDLAATPSLGGVPLLILVYPLYILLCISLALDALRHPGPSTRVMGDLARRRARPWLVAASLVLLLVSFLVGWAMLWAVLDARQRALIGSFDDMALTLARFDLIIAALIAVAILLQGQAVVSYEIFTGKTLPRRGLWRHWRSAVILAAGYGLVVGGSLATQLRPVYSLLLSTLLMAVFYALFSWRSYAERERTMAYLRPFVTSQRLYEHLLTPSAPPEVDAAGPFRAMCEEVLGAGAAYLVPLGPLAPLVGQALIYPAGAKSQPPSLAELIPHLSSPHTMCLPLSPAGYDGARWAVPLWSERGLIGVLLLGEKRDGGLYTQEEIEIARASGERLIDTQASVEMARRLMDLGRQRLVESQVLDRRARRVVHDEVLPRLHTAMLSLSRAGAETGRPPSDVVRSLGEVHRQLSDLLRDTPGAVAPEVEGIGLIRALRQLVDGELAGAFDGITWQIEPRAEREAGGIPLLSAEVLFYAAREAMRNAAHYGRGRDTARPLHLQVRVAWRRSADRAAVPGSQEGAEDGGLEILIQDDGVGTGVEDGASHGSGQGLALHSTMMAVVGGSLVVDSAPGRYTCVWLTLPLRPW
jgi:signal transduction histidine kinase